MLRINNEYVLNIVKKVVDLDKFYGRAPGGVDEGGHGQLDRLAVTQGVVFVRAIKGDGRVCPHITTHIHMDQGERSTGTSRIIIYRRRLDVGLPSVRGGKGPYPI